MNIGNIVYALIGAIISALLIAPDKVSKFLKEKLGGVGTTQTKKEEGSSEKSE